MRCAASRSTAVRTGSWIRCCASSARHAPGGHAADCFSPAERAVLAYTDALVLGGGRVHDREFAELQRHLSDEQILELTYITLMYEMHATMARALRMEFDDRADPIVEVAAPAGEMARDIGADISGGES